MLTAIQSAHQRIAPVVRETPVEPWTAVGPNVHLKLEHLQHTGSFKFRGASNKIAVLTPDQAARGVVAASNGNHGLGVAAAAKARNIAAEVFVSAHVSPAKARRIQSYGALITQSGADPLTAELAARQAAEATGRVFISPYNDADVIAGQGTIAVELLHQLPALDAVFVAVGGGGLIAGIANYLKAVSPKTEIIGCWPENSPVLLECLKAGRVIEVPEQPTLSESTAGNLEPGSITVELCQNKIDRNVLVTESEIKSALRLLLETEHWLVEGAAGVALAAYLKHKDLYHAKTSAIILCGRNLSPEALSASISASPRLRVEGEPA